MKKVGLQIVFFLFSISFAATVYAGPESSLFEPGIVEDRSSGTYDSWNQDYYGYSGDQYSGYYIGTVLSNQDDKGALESLIQKYFDDLSYEISSIDKIDIDDGEPYESGATTILIDSGTDSKSGSWELSNSYVAEFYTVKAATEFALYYVDPEVNSGLWWTGHLLTPNGKNIPGISHFSAVYTEGNNQPPENLVPEPATMILMGVGLLGLGFGLRKKNQQ